MANKESFVGSSTPSSECILKENHTQHPFSKPNNLKKRLRKCKKKKSVSFSDQSPQSPDNLSSVSTLTGTESLRHPYSESDGDSDIETYRIKSILRGKSPIVYVKGETIPNSKEITPVKLEKKDDEEALETDKGLNVDPLQCDTKTDTLNNLTDEGESPSKKCKAELDEGDFTTETQNQSDEETIFHKESTKAEDDVIIPSPPSDQTSSENDKQTTNGIN